MHIPGVQESENYGSHKDRRVQTGCHSKRHSYPPQQISSPEVGPHEATNQVVGWWMVFHSLDTGEKVGRE